MKIQQKYTVTEATDFLGFKSRSTINSRTKQKGSKAISYEMDENGNKIISIQELERVFPTKYNTALKHNKNTANTNTIHSTSAQESTKKNTANTTHLQHKVEMLEQELKNTHDLLNEVRTAKNKAEEREADLSKKLDTAQETLQASTMLLEDLRKKSLEIPENKKRGFWKNLFN